MGGDSQRFSCHFIGIIRLVLPYQADIYSDFDGRWEDYETSLTASVSFTNRLLSVILCCSLSYCKLCSASCVATMNPLDHNSVHRKPISPLSNVSSTQYFPADSGHENFESSVPLVGLNGNGHNTAYDSSIASIREGRGDANYDIDQHDERITRRSKYRSIWEMVARPFKFAWGLELLAAGVSVVTMIAMLVVLAVFDGRVTKELLDSVSLNSLVSALATIFRVALLIPMGAALRQSKWLWFVPKKTGERGSGNEIGDLEVFDDASRDPLGCVLLFFKLRGL